MGLDAQNLDHLREALDNKFPVLLSGNGIAISFQTLLLDVKSDQVELENRVRPAYIRRFMSSSQYTLQVGMVRFSTDIIVSDGEHMGFPLGENSVIGETRRSERFAFAPEECVVCEILNPFDGETRIAKTVMDMSATGLSLSTTYDSMLFKPDTFLPEIKVLVDGKPYNQSAGRVVYARSLLDLSGQLRRQVGIRFEKA